MLDEHDHRRLGPRLDLFHLQDDAPGSVFWHPRGLALHRALEQHARAHVLACGYQEVRSPQLLLRPVWEASGHWEHFRQDMLALEDGEGALKPVSCPGHLALARHARPSWRDLPSRLAEFGLVHRNEPRGALHGLFRLRQFTQDDGHVFCREAQVADEVARFCAGLRRFYAGFGFADVEAAFSSRPQGRAGSDALWDVAERALREAAEAAGLAPKHQPGQGAFYGPKLEFALRDRSGRAWQCGTLQLDFVLPGRFDLGYVEPGGERRAPVMLHRALYGSVERFLGLLLEHHRGVLPAWLCPEQAVVVPLGEARAYAEGLVRDLAAAGVRARLDAREEALGRKVRDAHALGVPSVLVVGEREMAWWAVRVRERGGVQRELRREHAVAELAAACAPPPVA